MSDLYIYRVHPIPYYQQYNNEFADVYIYIYIGTHEAVGATPRGIRWYQNIYEADWSRGMSLSRAYKSRIIFHKRSEISWCRPLYVVLLHYRNIVMFLYTAHVVQQPVHSKPYNEYVPNLRFADLFVGPPRDLFLLTVFFLFHYIPTNVLPIWVTRG